MEGRDWQGVQSLPRTVQLDSDAKLLRIRPASELQALREQTLYQHQHQEHNVSTTTDGDAVVHTIPAQGLQLEILVRIFFLYTAKRRIKNGGEPFMQNELTMIYIWLMSVNFAFHTCRQHLPAAAVAVAVLVAHYSSCKDTSSESSPAGFFFYLYLLIIYLYCCCGR